FSVFSYISWVVIFHAMIFFVSASVLSASIASCARSRRVSKSPIPRRREMNRGGSNFSRSSIFSPTPMKTMGAFTSATAERAPPPFAVPSSFVTMTPVIPTASCNAFVWGPACCPTVASITRNRSSASTAFATASISAIRSGSSAWRPDEEDPLLLHRDVPRRPEDFHEVLVDDPNDVLARAHARGRFFLQGATLELLRNGERQLHVHVGLDQRTLNVADDFFDQGFVHVARARDLAEGRAERVPELLKDHSKTPKGYSALSLSTWESGGHAQRPRMKQDRRDDRRHRTERQDDINGVQFVADPRQVEPL